MRLNRRKVTITSFARSYLKRVRAIKVELLYKKMKYEKLIINQIEAYFKHKISFTATTLAKKFMLIKKKIGGKKKMKLTKILLVNFRNFKSLEMDFTPGSNEIAKSNAWGKSNIADAISWVLTGKLADGTSDIDSIKPKYDFDRQKDFVEVNLYFDNGLELKKTYQENWVKTRGTTDYELKGNLTRCFWNLGEVTITVFNKQLEENLGTTLDYVRILINPTFFGNTLDWKERRKIVNKIIGEITSEDIYQVKPNLKAIDADIKRNNNDATLAKNRLQKEVNVFKKQAEDLDAKIEGNVIENPISAEEKADLVQKIEQFNTRIVDARVKKESNVNPVIAKLQQEKNSSYELLSQSRQADSMKLNDLNKDTMFSIKENQSKLADLQLELQSFRTKSYETERQISTHEGEINVFKSKIDANNNEIQRLRSRWTITNEMTAPAQPKIDESNCPQCGFVLNQEHVKTVKVLHEAKVIAFNLDRANNLASITAEGKALSTKNVELNQQVEATKAKIELLKTTNASNAVIMSDLTTNINSLEQRIESLKSKLLNEYVSDTTKAVLAQIEDIKAQIELEQSKPSDSAIDHEIEGYKAMVQNLQVRVDMYAAQEIMRKKTEMFSTEKQEVIRRMADYENKIDMLTMYTQTFLEIMNERITLKFGDIQFKLVENNITEGSWNEVCYIMDGDVPYERTNTASKIKLGVKLIEAIRRNLNLVSLPIIIDNAEAVVDRQFDTSAQTIMFVAANAQ